MLFILVTVQIILLATVGFLVAYLFMLSVFAAFAPVPVQVDCKRARRFVVIVPAHDEEFTISPTIKSLLELDYPRESFDVVVIADNCTDGTADVARQAGATVLERTNVELRGKGHALRWCFDQLLSHPYQYEAFVVIDADSIVSPNFLAVMNQHLEVGDKVIQASDLVKPQPGAWSSEITRVGFTLYNFARPMGRQVMGCSVGLRGNGMCLSADVLRVHPWEAYTRTEDLEFGLSLLLRAGISVAFAPNATVLATMPHNAQLAESQRARWEGGRFPVVKKYAPLLLRYCLRHGSFRSLDLFVDLVTPPVVNLMGMVLGILFLTIALILASVAYMLPFMYLWVCIFLLGVLHMLIGLYAARADWSLYRALLYIPRYAVWKVVLYVKLIWHGGTDEWIRTSRETAASHKDSIDV